MGQKLFCYFLPKYLKIQNFSLIAVTSKVEPSCWSWFDCLATWLLNILTKIWLSMIIRIISGSEPQWGLSTTYINHHHPSSHDYPYVGLIFTFYHHQYIGIFVAGPMASVHIANLVSPAPLTSSSSPSSSFLYLLPSEFALKISLIGVNLVVSFWFCSVLNLKSDPKKLSMSSHLKCNLTDKRKKCLRHLGSSLREVLSNISSASGKSLYEVALICILTLRRGVRLNVALSDTKPRRGREWNS